MLQPGLLPFQPKPRGPALGPAPLSLAQQTSPCGPTFFFPRARQSARFASQPGPHPARPPSSPRSARVSAEPQASSPVFPQPRPPRTAQTSPARPRLSRAPRAPLTPPALARPPADSAGPRVRVAPPSCHPFPPATPAASSSPGISLRFPWARTPRTTSAALNPSNSFPPRRTSAPPQVSKRRRPNSLAAGDFCTPDPPRHLCRILVSRFVVTGSPGEPCAGGTTSSAPASSPVSVDADFTRPSSLPCTAVSHTSTRSTFCTRFHTPGPVLCAGT